MQDDNDQAPPATPSPPKTTAVPPDVLAEASVGAAIYSNTAVIVNHSNGCRLTFLETDPATGAQQNRVAVFLPFGFLGDLYDLIGGSIRKALASELAHSAMAERDKAGSASH